MHTPYWKTQQCQNKRSIILVTSLTICFFYSIQKNGYCHNNKFKIYKEMCILVAIDLERAENRKVWLVENVKPVVLEELVVGDTATSAVLANGTLKHRLFLEIVVLL